MKQKFKQIIALFAISSLIILSGCTQEKDFVNEHNHPNIDFKEKSFKEALSMPIFNDAYQKVAKRKSDFKSSDEARTALEDQFGFTIVADSPIRIVTNENGTIFYTILIEREVKEELVFENLMIKVENNETTAAIFKYSMTEKGTSLGDNNYILNGISSTEYTDLNIDSRVFYNAGGETCSIINVLLCDTADHRPAGHIATSSCWNGNGNTIYFGTALACVGNEQTSGGGANGDPGGPSSNNTGGVGASGGSTDPVVVSPIPCRTGNCIEADIKTPCKELEDFYSKPTVNTLSNNLITKLNLVKENGFDATVSLSPSGDIIYNFSEAPPEICKKNSIKWPKINNRIIIDHTHTLAGDSYQIPSVDDIFSLYNLTMNFTIVPFPYNSDLFFVGVTVNGFKYAIKIDDANALNDAFVGLTKIKLENMNDALEKRMMTIGTPDTALPNPMAKEFLIFSKNFGIKLYRKSFFGDTDWKELKLNSNETDIEEIPCTN